MPELLSEFLGLAQPKPKPGPNESPQSVVRQQPEPPHGLVSEFLGLAQPSRKGDRLDKPQTEDPRFPEAPITPQSLPGSQKIGGAVVQGLAKGTGAGEVLKAERGGPKLLSAAAPLIDQFFKLVQGSGEAVQSDTVMEKSGEIGGQTFMGGLTVAGLRSGAGAGEGQIGVFGGKGARAADLTKLERAKFMEEAGSSAGYIRRNTWWYRDVDKEWKFEIPDKGSKFTKPDSPLGAPKTLSEVYEHPRLYQQYPELKGTKVYWDGERGGAHFQPSDKSFHLDAMADETTLRSHVSHEIQHWIQHKEGFAQGANSQALGAAARLVLKYKGIENPTPAQMDDMAFELYRRHAGEAESRNVQTRLDYSPETLAAVHPHHTLDVPPEKQIVRKLGETVTQAPADLFKSTEREIPVEQSDEVKSAPPGLKWLEKVVSPSTRSATSQDAAAAIRAASGQAARDKAITMAQLEPWHRKINAMPEPERLAFLQHIEGRSAGVPLSDPSLQGLADVLRDAFLRRQAKLSAMPSHMMMQFIDDYFPHFWQDPATAQNLAHQFAGRPVGKMGSGASTQKRAIPTIADGMAMGLKPLTTNPLEATARYITSMDHFIARTEVVEAAKGNGTITFPKRQQIGASGHPSSGQLPRTDLVPVKGVLDKNGVQGVAPEDWARVWNNYVGQRWGGNVEAQNFFNTIQHGSNAITSMELGLSGFHVFTMANEAFIGELARGFANIAGGQFTRGLGAIGQAVAAPVRLARVGAKGADVYLDRSPGSQQTRQLVDLISRAGGRMVGKEHAADYEYSAMGNFWTAFKRGALKQELREAAGRVKGPISGVKEGFSLLGKSLETIAYPLFVKYIPALKNGAAMELLGDWLHANPAATYEEQLGIARKIWDSIDNRFGEMVQDNLFWNNSLKQVAQTGLRSFSWNLGTIREVGGGIVDAARGTFEHAVTGKGPSLVDQFRIDSPDFNPKLGYVLALPIGTAIMGMVYQYLKTGKGPESVEDTQHPQTGGEAPGFGGRGEVPERAALPGYMKDVYGWWHDPMEEASAKVATGPKMAWQSLTNRDWQDKMIRNPSDPIYQQIIDYFKWVGDSLGPISAHTLIKGQKEGSNISTPESMLGIRPAPTYVQDPEGYEHGMGKIYQERHKREQRSKQRQERQYGGSEE